MDAIYSLTLLAALVAAVVGVLTAITALRRPAPRLAVAALTAVGVAVVFGSASFLVHLVFGHGPESPEPMSIGHFLRIHPAYLGLFLLCAVGLGGWALSRRRE